MPEIEVMVACEADLMERWVLNVTDDEFTTLQADPDEALELLSTHFVSVENVSTDAERERDVVAINVIAATGAPHPTDEQTVTVGPEALPHLRALIDASRTHPNDTHVNAKAIEWAEVLADCLEGP